MSTNFVLFASCAISLVCSITSLALRYWETPPEVMRRISTIEVDLQETIDTFTRWMKRENVRRARDKQEQSQDENALPAAALDSSSRKAEIRAKIARRMQA